ncbi:hypothetical protein JCM14469_40760 [Desulfatiferula olefinivorans]
MRFFPFKIFVLCLILPPVLYFGSAKWLEATLASTYTREISRLCTADMKALLDGRVRLRDAVDRTIDGFLADRPAVSGGLRMIVTVSTLAGTPLYPSMFDDSHDLLQVREPLRVAEENYRLLNEGLDVRVSVSLEPNSLVSYLLFAAFMVLSILLFYGFYRRGMIRVRQEQEDREREWVAMLERDEENRRCLARLSEDRKALDERLEEMKAKLSEANRSEDGMIEEIESLETKIQQNEKRQKEQQEEIEALKAAIESAGAGRKSKSKSRGQDFVAKRFKTVYKNISVHERAVEGYQDLEEAMKIKCEEVIHQLNDEPDQVTIKRKVFGKKNRETVFEVLFAYKGRLYFRRLKDNTIEILAVGTKNTQDRELDFLDRL